MCCWASVINSDGLKGVKGVGPLNADVILRDAYHFCDAARGCTDAYLFDKGGCASFLKKVLRIPKEKWEAAVSLLQTEIPKRVRHALLTLPDVKLPPDAVALLSMPLLKTAAENHTCEGLKMMRALLFEKGVKQWRGLEKISNTKSFNLEAQNAVWKPPTDRPIQVAVPAGGSHARVGPAAEGANGK